MSIKTSRGNSIHISKGIASVSSSIGVFTFLFYNIYIHTIRLALVFKAQWCINRVARYIIKQGYYKYKNLESWEMSIKTSRGNSINISNGIASVSSSIGVFTFLFYNTYIHTYIHTSIHIYIHTYMHAYIHYVEQLFSNLNDVLTG